MNERIKDLLPNPFAVDYQYKDGPLDLYTEKEMIRFAALIVRECVKVMYDNAIERKVPPDINQTPTHYAIAVLEHFGVEE